MKTFNRIEITGPFFREASNVYHATFQISGLSQPELIFSVDLPFKDFFSPRADGAMIALLAAAMEAGTDVHINGEVSEQLLFNCNKYIIPLLAGAFERLSVITITAEKVSSERGSPSAVLTGLSNGIDSLTVCADHLNDSIFPSLKLTHFLFNDVGSHGALINAGSHKIHEQRRQRAVAAAEFLNLPLIQFSSNLDYFYKTPFFMTHTLRNAAVALCMQNGVKKFLYASGVSYEHLSTKKIRDTAYIDPILLPLLSTESLDISSSGSSYSRTKKTSLVADTEVAQKFLDVCVTEGENCSTCWKCARTIMTLQLLGKEKNFSQVFNLKLFAQIRSGFIAHLTAARRNDPLCAEIAQLMDEVNFELTATQRLKNRCARLLYILAKKVPVWRLTLLYNRFTGFMP